MDKESLSDILGWRGSDWRVIGFLASGVLKEPNSWTGFPYLITGLQSHNQDSWVKVLLLWARLLPCLCQFSIQLPHDHGSLPFSVFTCIPAPHYPVTQLPDFTSKTYPFTASACPTWQVFPNTKREQLSLLRNAGTVELRGSETPKNSLNSLSLVKGNAANGGLDVVSDHRTDPVWGKFLICHFQQLKSF